MIGLSVSFCVHYIAAGKVNLDEVEKIVAGTRISSWRKQSRIIRQYLRTYWRDNPEACEAIYRRLVSNTKRAMRGGDPQGAVIEQPRLHGKPAPLLAGASGIQHWVKSEAEIQWCEH